MPVGSTGCVQTHHREAPTVVNEGARRCTMPTCKSPTPHGFPLHGGPPFAVGERNGTRTRRSKGGPCWCELPEGTMPDASTSECMSPGLRKVAERARKEPEGKFLSLAHLIDVPSLERAYH